MLISYHWLKKFINLKENPQKTADKITLNLVEVESLKKNGDDIIFEVENKGITNRADCFSQLGFAREIAAYFKLSAKDYLKRLANLKFTRAKNLPFKVEITKPALCFRYSSCVLTGIKVKPSPKWLRTGVENCGLRSINNIVDVTNYVMLELGQPLHAFDYLKLNGNNIIVRNAQDGEEIKTLDGVIRKLNKNILVIADAKYPVAIAGVIGGAKAEITSATSTIVLESANFERYNNRQTEKILKLRTEASTRFEKGLDVNLTMPALNRAISLLQKLTGAKLASKTIDVQIKKVKPWKITTSQQWINKFLGLKLTTLEMVNILKRLQLDPRLENGRLSITIPTYRSDLRMPADIAEEIARIYGYDNIPITPLTGPIIPPQPNQSFNLTKKVKLFMQSTGFSEILTAPFISKNLLEDFFFDPQKHLKLINPLTVEQKFLRQSLVPQLIMSAKSNLRYFNNLKLFEINRIFIPQGKSQPTEIVNLAALVSGKNCYLELKGMLESLFSFLGIKVKFVPLSSAAAFWQANKTAKIIGKNLEDLGAIGKINQKILNKIGFVEDLSVVEINFSKIISLANLSKTFKPIPCYPPVFEDLSFIVQPQVYCADLLTTIKFVSKLIKNVVLTSQYKNTLTFRITYQNPKANLTEKEVGKIRGQIITRVKERGLGELKGKG